jgi:hypothetical protein
MPRVGTHVPSSPAPGTPSGIPATTAVASNAGIPAKHFRVTPLIQMSICVGRHFDWRSRKCHSPWLPSKNVDEITATAVYLVISMVCAVSAFVVAGWSRHEGSPAPNYCGRLALAAGLLWPVVMIGLAQLFSLIMIQRIFHPRTVVDDFTRLPVQHLPVVQLSAH